MKYFMKLRLNCLYINGTEDFKVECGITDFILGFFRIFGNCFRSPNCFDILRRVGRLDGALARRKIITSPSPPPSEMCVRKEGFQMKQQQSRMFVRVRECTCLYALFSSFIFNIHFSVEKINDSNHT